ncbi:cation:proton antiporter [Sulfurovum sp. NBC37-1]|uniref:cation:proton antiporter n=1 Tax=Sulfurovum sp. (strain NBC37-1) TaxID=387093 RepID=UPI000158775B|nr:cation:proton antiporter [Sulfurovum sp. NBC37-1]BAF71608.1 glutathione-regulated potassium-efflux system protein [Sulfurovum sp. NBC37-1]
MENVLIVLIVTIAIATVLNIILKKFDIPTVIGYVLSGFAISSFYHFAEDSREVLSHLAEFGIVFLMFTIGLEFSVKHLKHMKKEVFLFGGLQVMLSGILFSIISHLLFHQEMKSAIVIGFALSLSSTAIVLKILNEKNEIHSGYGRGSVGILIFQDLAVIPMLLMVSIFTSQTDSVSVMLFNTLISALLVFAILFIVGKYFLERFFDLIMETDSEEIFLVAVLLGVISASVLAEVFGFSYSLGAFIAGMMLSETKYRYRIEADLVPFRDILLGVFFVTIGMLIDWHAILIYWHIILGLLAGIMLLKGFLIFGILQFFVQKRTALKTALALFEVGEFALAIFALANSKGLIDPGLNQILIITVVLSMIITPFVLKNIKAIADKLIKEPDTLRERAMIGGTYKDHIIVCGYGPLGQRLVKSFKEKNLLYVILEHDVKVVDAVIAKGEESIFFANAAQKMVLEHFNVDQCCAIIVTIDNEIQKQLICENIASFGPHINSIVKVMNNAEGKTISSLGIKHVVNARNIVADIMEQEVLACQLSIKES